MHINFVILFFYAFKFLPVSLSELLFCCAFSSALCTGSLSDFQKRPGDVSFLMDVNEKMLENPEFCIDAGSIGNVARFINHSCEPNLFVQCILSSHHDIRLAKIVLCAADTIPPLQVSILFHPVSVSVSLSVPSIYH